MVLNGNGRTGAAASAASRVRSRGYRIGTVGNASSTDYARSLVMYKPGFAGEARRLAKDLRVKQIGPLDGIRAARPRPRAGRLHPRRVGRARARGPLLLGLRRCRCRRRRRSPARACGTSHWLNPKPCANAIVVHGRQGAPGPPRLRAVEGRVGLARRVLRSRRASDRDRRARGARGDRAPGAGRSATSASGWTRTRTTRPRPAST